MTAEAPVSTLHRVDFALVIRHLTGCSESARDRVGGRHRRILQLYCTGWSEEGPFACLIRDPDGHAAITRFGANAQPFAPSVQRSIRLKAVRSRPDAVWHHPYPLETVHDYELQDAVLHRHLAEHASQAGWTGAHPDEAMTVAAGGMPAGNSAQRCFLEPPLLHEGPAQRLWAPDPDAPPSRIRVFPGFVDYHGRRFRVTGRDRPDPRDDGLTMEYCSDDYVAPSRLWLSEGGRIAP